ncbi:MAG: N-6 DNA methylase [Sedimentibacter sp.]|uniref:N-6 DNA methylase n=1 Tax=Sedimentibacter sp. TaxID=1960295 RepID=UPI003157F244
MDKSLAKEVTVIINEIEHSDYIFKVKYVIFFICRFLCSPRFMDSFDPTLEISGQLSNLFSGFEEYDLKDSKTEEKIRNLAMKHSDAFDPDCFQPGELYELLLTSKEKKKLGQVYTPKEVIDSMLTQAFELKKVDKHTRILDPACGSGYFLVEAFRKIKEMNLEGVDDRYIAENMLCGVDVDDFSVFLAKMGMLFLSRQKDVCLNIYKNDFLTEDLDLGKFDIVVGNPPYVGHKNSVSDYKKILYYNYPDVFYDKSDISYCFFKKSHDVVKQDGIVSFITSRYFMEAMYADRLRIFLKNNFRIVSLTDYSGNNLFSDAMVSPAVIVLSKETWNKNDFSYVKYHEELNAEKYPCKQDNLKSSGWIILRDEEQNLFDRIEALSNTYLKDVCTIKQGIITGLDKAFIVDEETIEKYGIESFLLKKWIKNSNIRESGIKYNNLYLIYSNNITDEKDCPNAIRYLSAYREKLAGRRECLRGYRKWYELQWGRVEDDFENHKIIFPYKAKNSNFYYDENAFFCSADVYLMNGIKSGVNTDYLVSYLNSSMFEFYFKSQAKKVGNGLYEYYPNKLNNIKFYLPQENIQLNLSDLGKISVEIFLKKVFNINEEEVKNIIYKYIQKR